MLKGSSSVGERAGGMKGASAQERRERGLGGQRTGRVEGTQGLGRSRTRQQPLRPLAVGVGAGVRTGEGRIKALAGGRMVTGCGLHDGQSRERVMELRSRVDGPGQRLQGGGQIVGHLADSA